MKIKRLVLTVLGFICIGLGAVGVAIPVMPTTPFVLLAAFCFSAGNIKFYEWLRHNRVFGQYLENFRTKQGVSVGFKIISITFLWTGLIISMVIVRTVFIYAVLGIVGICVTIHLLLIKTKKDAVTSSI